jgi:uncharacterized Fe-S cluster-containing radical SAM superfamily protein
MMNSTSFVPANLKAKVRSTTKLYAKNDHTFYNVTDCKGEYFLYQLLRLLNESLDLFAVQFSMGGLKFRMTNLFEGSKALGEIPNNN